MTKVFLTADTHFCHKNIIKYCYRPFSTVEDMNEVLIERWNAVVSDDDIVIHVGDFGFGSVKKLAEIRERLNGYITLVLGNHDWGISKEKWVTDLWMVQAVDRLPEEQLKEYGLEGFNVTHLPYYDDHTSEVRFLQKRIPDDGKWLICGHVHDKWHIKDHMVNVGVDCYNFYPVSVEDLKEEIRMIEKHNKSYKEMIELQRKNLRDKMSLAAKHMNIGT